MSEIEIVVLDDDDTPPSLPSQANVAIEPSRDNFGLPSFDIISPSTATDSVARTDYYSLSYIGSSFTYENAGEQNSLSENMKSVAKASSIPDNLPHPIPMECVIIDDDSDSVPGIPTAEAVQCVDEDEYITTFMSRISSSNGNNTHSRATQSSKDTQEADSSISRNKAQPAFTSYFSRNKNVAQKFRLPDEAPESTQSIDTCSSASGNALEAMGCDPQVEDSEFVTSYTPSSFFRSNNECLATSSSQSSKDTQKDDKIQFKKTVKPALKSNKGTPVVDSQSSDATSLSLTLSPQKPGVKKGKAANSKEEKERKKIERDRLRELKKQEILAKKTAKAQLAASKKSLKPEEVIKTLTVHIDTNIVNSAYGAHVVAALQKEDIKYKVESLATPFTISWSKISKVSSLDAQGELVEKENVTEEDDILKMVMWSEVVELASKNELLSVVKSWKTRGKRLTLIIVGFKKYWDYQSNKLNRNLKAAMTGSQVRRHKSETDLQAAAVLNHDDVEMALAELQIFAQCGHRNVDTGEELADLVFQWTKSISQIAFKREQYLQESRGNFYAKADNKGCVRVDKSGNGVTELWQQQICQFQNVTLEVAQAIIGEYKSLPALMAAYEGCVDSNAAAGLLADIRVRREAGILTSNRRVGPELSRKIYSYFTADDPNLIV